MKKILFAALITLSTNLLATEVYDCNFGGSHFNLKMADNDKITLENKFQKFDCEKSFVYFPGTEIEMPTLVCTGKYRKVTYYMNYLDESTIILSTNIVFFSRCNLQKNLVVNDLLIYC